MDLQGQFYGGVFNMDDLRFKRLENDVNALNLRVNDHDAMHAETGKRLLANDELIAVMKKTTDSHEEMANVAREVIELLKQLIKYLSWVGVAVKWSSYVAVTFTAAWHAVKWAMVKVGFFS